LGGTEVIRVVLGPSALDLIADQEVIGEVDLLKEQKGRRSQNAFRHGGGQGEHKIKKAKTKLRGSGRKKNENRLQAADGGLHHPGQGPAKRR